MSALGPQVTNMVSQRFQLPKDKAERVLPEVAPSVLSSLQDVLQNPQQNIGLLTKLSDRFLNDREPSNLEEGDGAVTQELLGGKLGTIASMLSNTLGIDASKSQSILSTVVPMVLNFIGKRAHSAEGNDLESLAKMFGVQGGLVDILGSFAGKSTEGSILGKITGMFGKK